jgi:hypothetical protein
MANPERNVEWAVTYDGDAIDTDMRQHPDRFAKFVLQIRDGRICTYKRVS